VVERLADGFLTMEAVKENGVHLHFGVRDFYGDLAAVTDVGSAKDRSHAATGDYGFNLVVIELFAGADGIPRRAASGNVIGRILRQAIRPAAVHANAFHVPNADDQRGDIITTVALVGNIHKAVCRSLQLRFGAQNGGHIGAAHRAMHTVRAKQQDISSENLVLADVRFDHELGTDAAAKNVAGVRYFQIRGGENTKAELIVGDGVIARELRCLAAAYQVAARIANMRNRGAVEAKSARHDRGGHIHGGSVAGVDYFGVGRLYQSSQQ
jgi:hypothetical protein